MNGRRRSIAIGVGAAAALAGAGVAWRQRQSESNDSAEALWAMQFDKPEGGKLVMAGFRGNPLVINFWATWCVPCIRELPALQRFQRDFASRGWRVIALAVDAPVPVLEFIARFKLDLPVGMAGIDGMELLQTLGNMPGGLPFTLVLGTNGRIERRRMGETKYEELASWAAAS
jgi:thiol-disulfide isomerase/thioredoxin